MRFLVVPQGGTPRNDTRRKFFSILLDAAAKLRVFANYIHNESGDESFHLPQASSLRMKMRRRRARSPVAAFAMLVPS
jgi:hypothetical protein